MQLKDLRIPGVRVLTPTRHEDLRGYLSESFNRRTLEEAGVPTDYVQDNDSFSRSMGTIRGLHFQGPPTPQAKLVRVVRGAIMDVVLDLRVGSPTFGEWEMIEISAERGIDLAEGALVSAGMLTGAHEVVPDSSVRVDFGSFGAFDLAFEAFEPRA